MEYRHLLGVFGFPVPYKHGPIGLEELNFNMDIVGGVVGSIFRKRFAEIRLLIFYLITKQI